MGIGIVGLHPRATSRSGVILPEAEARGGAGRGGAEKITIALLGTPDPLPHPPPRTPHPPPPGRDKWRNFEGWSPAGHSRD